MGSWKSRTHARRGYATTPGAGLDNLLLEGDVGDGDHFLLEGDHNGNNSVLRLEGIFT